jgi:hypothetical protein
MPGVLGGGVVEVAYAPSVGKGVTAMVGQWLLGLGVRVWFLAWGYSQGACEIRPRTSPCSNAFWC